MQLVYQIALYIIAWAILIMGILVGKKNPSIDCSDPQGALYVVEVKIGLLIFIVSIIVSIIIFSFIAFEGFNLPNYFTVLACVFGIGIAFYFLYKMPPEIKDTKE